MKKKTIAAIIIAGAVVSGTVAAFQTGLITMPKTSNTYPSDIDGTMIGYDVCGKQIVPMLDGSYVNIGEDIYISCLSPDREHILYITNDKDFYVCDGEGKHKQQIDSDVRYFHTYFDSFIIYGRMDDTYAAYNIERDEIIEMGVVQQMNLSRDLKSCTYIVDGELFTFTSEDNEATRISPKGVDTATHSVPANGNSFITWLDYTDDQVDLYAYRDGKNELVAEVEDYDYNQSNLNSFINGDGSVHIYRLDNTLVVCTAEDEIVCNLDYSIAQCYTADGDIKEATAGFHGVYLQCYEDASDEYSLYYLDEDGELTEMLDDLTDLTIADSYVYYSEDGDMYRSSLDGAELGDDEEIDEDVDCICPNVRGGYVYYMKDCKANGKGTLCVTKQGKSPKEIDDQVHVVSLDYGYVSKITVNTTGDTCYYFKDFNDNGNSPYEHTGDLYTCRYGKSPEQLGEHIYANHIGTGNLSGLPEDDTFIFLGFDKNPKYDRLSDDEDMDKYMNVIYLYDGKSVTKFGSHNK